MSQKCYTCGIYSLRDSECCDFQVCANCDAGSHEQDFECRYRCPECGDWLDSPNDTNHSTDGVETYCHSVIITGRAI